ncbi:unnamed protein product [Ranitomeya imitator]|uniref:Reverse transcriptase domain-containing protein n=1 Tax=Ranitomeya imitator TaxID=111125 RepID=A0ABN9KR89_9NEOB|nr:unnamed protein product [Ranitomeya imitator]
MSTETYVYDDATGSTILSKIKTKTDFLHLPSKDAKSRDWEKERKRLIGYDLHCATLGEYHRQGKIPRGLRCNLRPTLFSENEKYCATFQKILNKCSFDIILLTIEYLQEAIKTTEEKIESIETQLNSTLSSTEFTTLKGKVDSILTIHQKTLEERKRTKFQRDIEDYLTNNVYKWEDSFPKRPRPRYRRTPGGNYHSGGSSPAGGSSAGSGSETELKVLNMGLSFCPTPKWDSFQLERDLQQFYRNIRLKVYFEESTNSFRPVSTPAQTEGSILTIDQLGLRNRSTFIPPKSSHAVETFVNLLDRDVKKTLHDQRLGFLPVRHNLDSLEKQALDSLSENKNIVIKPADKGGAIVVMDRSFYMTEVRRQLSDTSTYKMLQTDPTYAIQQKISRVLDKHLQMNTIDKKTKVYLTNNHPVTPVIYILPKIHKNLQNPPGRPIVASTDSILNPLSMFLEKLLTPHTKLTKSFILDTGDFLKKIRNVDIIPHNSILCTFDVNSLYTSIAHDKGIEAVSLTLNEANVDRGTQELCLDLLNLVLRENYFLFGDDFFVQTCGTAMGSNVAPAYANLYMDRFEKEYVYTDPIFQLHARTWYRYIDDIFCIWQGDLTSLLKFHANINAVRPELSFTLVYHDKEVTFLDTRVLKDINGHLTTDIYMKPTDCNSLLLYNSCHPKSIKNSLPRSQFKRVTRIVSDPPTRETRIQEMAQKFEARNYPTNLLEIESSRAISDLNDGTPYLHVRFVLRQLACYTVCKAKQSGTARNAERICSKRLLQQREQSRVEWSRTAGVWSRGKATKVQSRQSCKSAECKQIENTRKDTGGKEATDKETEVGQSTDKAMEQRHRDQDILPPGGRKTRSRQGKEKSF